MRDNKKLICIGFWSYLTLAQKAELSSVPLESTQRNTYIQIMIYHIPKQISDKKSEEFFFGNMCLSLLVVDGVQRAYLDQLNKFYIV